MLARRAIPAAPRVQRVAAAFVERQLIEHIGRHDHRDRNLLITLGDEKRHRAGEFVGKRAQGGQAQLAHVVVERSPEHSERGSRAVATVLSLRDEPELGQRGEQPIRDRAMYTDVVGHLLRGQPRSGGSDQLQRGQTPGQGLRAGRTVRRGTSARLCPMSGSALRRHDAPSLTDALNESDALTIVHVDVR
jgi:hypothetical protein